MVTTVDKPATTRGEPVSEIELRNAVGRTDSFEWPEGEGPILSRHQGMLTLFLRNNHPIDLELLSAVRQ